MLDQRPWSLANRGAIGGATAAPVAGLLLLLGDLFYLRVLEQAGARAYLGPLAIVSGLTVGFAWAGTVKRTVLLGVATATALALLVAGYGFNLGPEETARLVARAHPDLPRPVRCRSHDGDKPGSFDKTYYCYFGKKSSPFEIAVNDEQIVAEYP